MKEQSNGVKIEAASVTDRGLSEKRPLNEDSFLSDPARRIFAVADGVGGAQAGEVASKTAMEVLDEAFRHQMDGTDIEDLMEVAIQRANASIHQMALEHPKLSAMATTVVALHLDGHIATIGHVGDSRLYRLSPDGQLHRETADHSIVEEEVRAGRMTPEQAAHHPSRNVISRALGAETGVEVDMKTIEVEDGTTFMLCSDGITRHLPDAELRELLITMPDLEEACAEMKRRCYERGAEDNLTAVIVRVGERLAIDSLTVADARAAQAERALARTVDSGLNVAPAQAPQAQPEQSRINIPAAPSTLPPPPVGEANALPRNPVLALEEQARARHGGGAGRGFLVLLLIVGIGAAAFFGGMYFQSKRTVDTAQASPTPTPQPTPDDSLEGIEEITKFENRRHLVDKRPGLEKEALNAEAVKEEQVAGALESKNPELLYLYGRAMMLTGYYPDAAIAFEHASIYATELARANPSDKKAALYEKLKTESRLAFASMVLKQRLPLTDSERRAVSAIEELKVKPASPSPSPSPEE
ncbi:MAG TPA: PP2C family serine/threonine-protein phosphatase [Pyrinomonadaceae bacterium]